MCVRSRRLLFPALLGAAVAVWAADPLLVADQARPTADEDLILGTWHLNLAKSKYSPGPTPENQVRTYEAHRDGVVDVVSATLFSRNDVVSLDLHATEAVAHTTPPMTPSQEFGHLIPRKAHVRPLSSNALLSGRRRATRAPARWSGMLGSCRITQ